MNRHSTVAAWKFQREREYQIQYKQWQSELNHIVSADVSPFSVCVTCTVTINGEVSELYAYGGDQQQEEYLLRKSAQRILIKNI
jgi:hypothetical protein